MAKGGSVHTVSAQIAHMHVMAGNAEYVKEGATNRAVGVENSDSVPKKRNRKRWKYAVKWTPPIVEWTLPIHVSVHNQFHSNLGNNLVIEKPEG